VAEEKVTLNQIAVLIEGVKSDVKAVAEGHQVIRSEMRQMEDRLAGKISLMDDKLEFVAKQLGDQIDKVDRKLDEHMRKPAHV
jgi:hypothetical protein